MEVTTFEQANVGDKFLRVYDSGEVGRIFTFTKHDHFQATSPSLISGKLIFHTFVSGDKITIVDRANVTPQTPVQAQSSFSLPIVPEGAKITSFVFTQTVRFELEGETYEQITSIRQLN